MAYAPGAVATKFTMRTKKDEDYNTVSTEKATRACFRDVGNEYLTHGNIGHEFKAWQFTNLGPILTIVYGMGFSKMGKEGTKDKLAEMMKSYEENRAKEKKTN